MQQGQRLTELFTQCVARDLGQRKHHAQLFAFLRYEKWHLCIVRSIALPTVWNDK